MGDTDELQNWVAQSRKGDHAAFAELIRAHQTMIHSLTFRMTGSVADCKDLAQETFIRAYQQLDSYQGSSKLSSWLYRIAVNACLDWRRREQRREKLHASWSEANLENEADADISFGTDELIRLVQQQTQQRSGQGVSVNDAGGNQGRQCAVQIERANAAGALVRLVSGRALGPEPVHTENRRGHQQEGHLRKHGQH